MTYYLISSLINAITSFGVAFLVFSANRKNQLNKLFIRFAVSVGFWALFYFLWALTMNEEQKNLCLFFIRLTMTGSIFIPFFFTEFIIALVNYQSNKFNLSRWNLYSTLFFLISCFSNYFIQGFMTVGNFEFWPKPGILFYFFHIWFSFNVIFSLSILIKSLNASKKPEVHKRNFIVLMGMLIGFAGGMTNHFMWYKVNIPPVGNILVAVYVAAVAYAIIRHQFLEIEVIVRKTLIFAGILGVVFALFTAATFLIRDVISIQFKLSPTWANIISLVVIVLSYDYIRNFLINLTDKFLFQKGYNYQKLLKDASRGMSKIESLEHLLSLVIHFITMKMRVKNAAVLSKVVDSSNFRMEYQRGYEKNFLEFHLEEDSPLIRYLRQEKEAVDLERINEYLDSGSKKKSRSGGYQIYDFAAIREEMQRIHSVCCVPSFLGEDLRNILLLGEKKSGQFFTDEDLSVLYTLAQESSIAIENARLFDEAVRKSAELEKINEQLAFSRDLLSKALAETEVANKQLQDTQAQLIHEQKMATLGRLAASVGHEVNNPLTILSMNVSRALLKYRKNPDLRVSEILDLFDKMEQNINRIKAVVNTLTGLLKKSEKGKFEPLSLKLILEETLPLVQFQTYLDNLTGTEVEFDVPSSLPLVRGDLERLQEVFLNLFINAYHAMAEKRDRKIKVWAEVSAENQGFVSIYFQDNGSGMKPETMAKIFNYGFTTKPPGRGSGLGLYMCKYIIELHGGDIKVTSELGAGTTFILTLPAFSEVTTIAGDDAGFNRKASGE